MLYSNEEASFVAPQTNSVDETDQVVTAEGHRPIHLRGGKHPPSYYHTKPNQLPAGGPAHVSHGCLLIPVFLAAWFYWTKKTYRKVVSRLIRHGTEPDNERFDDNFFRFGDGEMRW
jgi:hypothetical protein